MKISAQEEYGLRCMLQIARAEEGHSVSITDIASAEGLSAPYVAKLLSVLRNAGLIASVRGRAGGYRLAAAPALIGLGSIFQALGEPLFDELDYCARHAGSESSDGNCVHHGDCTLRALWSALESWVRRSLDRITLADLLQGENEIAELVHQRLAAAALEPRLPLIELTRARPN
jgi:Rrf2 family protein